MSSLESTGIWVLLSSTLPRSMVESGTIAWHNEILIAISAMAGKKNFIDLWLGCGDKSRQEALFLIDNPAAFTAACRNGAICFQYPKASIKKTTLVH